MDWDHIEGNWKQVKAKVKEKWGKLTDDDLDAISGRRDQLESKIQQRYGFATDHVRQEVDDWFRWQDSGRPSSTTAIPMRRPPPRARMDLSAVPLAPLNRRMA